MKGLNTASAVTFVVFSKGHKAYQKESQYCLRSNHCGLIFRLVSLKIYFCLNTASAVTFVVLTYKLNFFMKNCLNTASAVTFVVRNKIIYIWKHFCLNTASAVTFVVHNGFEC